MTSSPNPKVDWYFDKAVKWQDEIKYLRKIVLDCGLSEELKWGVPCYTLNGSNILLIHTFKDYCAILFHKGALLKDADNLLIQQTPNVQSALQLRFMSLQDITRLEVKIKANINDAIEVEKSGQEVEFKKHTEFAVPEELQYKLNELPALKDAFEALTPGRQKAYLLYFSAPKLSKTRAARVEKYIDVILDGLGLGD